MTGMTVFQDGEDIADIPPLKVELIGFLISKDRHSNGLLYFTALPSMPEMNWRWRARKKMMIGMVAMVTPDIT